MSMCINLNIREKERKRSLVETQADLFFETRRTAYLRGMPFKNGARPVTTWWRESIDRDVCAWFCACIRCGLSWPVHDVVSARCPLSRRAGSRRWFSSWAVRALARAPYVATSSSVSVMPTCQLAIYCARNASSPGRSTASSSRLTSGTARSSPWRSPAASSTALCKLPTTPTIGSSSMAFLEIRITSMVGIRYFYCRGYLCIFVC